MPVMQFLMRELGWAEVQHLLNGPNYLCRFSVFTFVQESSISVADHSADVIWFHDDRSLPSL